MTRTPRFLLYTVTILCGITLVISGVDAGKAGEWKAYGSNKANTKYNSLDQINADNVKDLRIAWRWKSPDNEIVKEKHMLQVHAY